MKHIVKTVSLLSILAIIPGAMAATSRISVTNKASPRLPSIAGYLISGTTTSTATSTTSSTASYYSNSECIEKYTDCVKADDVCGSDFQECTTNVLFHGQMAKCLSVLYQCQSSGVSALFGTSSISSLSGIASQHYNDANEIVVDAYTYPTSGSVLGQLIIGASITNQLTTEQCVKRYTNCLHRDDVCGADFELCTGDKPFKKQALLCDSTLQRCQSDGKKQLFGSVANANGLTPDNQSRLGIMIKEGGDLAALNAVKTCHKVVDTCLYNACVKNPLRCVEGIPLKNIYLADVLAGGTLTEDVIDANDTNSATQIRKMLKSQCLSTIGTNKYCHMTYRLTSTVSDRDVVDVDLQEDVFADAYSDRKNVVLPRVQEALKKFDTNAKNSCIDTIKSCAMRSCGGGLGSVCYQQAKQLDSKCTNNTGSATTATVRTNSTERNPVNINSNYTYNDIYAGCEAIVNADANCQYAAESDDKGYTYAFTTDDTTFTTLFPKCDEGKDKIGVVGLLNSLLATNYNDAAIEKMKKQCQNVALSCVKSMCGKDYVNCYRNRTDIVLSGTGSYDTGSSKFDKSMNKVGGVLDYNIVQGLCMNTVKNSSVCEEHLKIATAEWRYKPDATSWNSGEDDYSSVRDAWLGANTTEIDNSVKNAGTIVTGCTSSTDIADVGCLSRSAEACGYVDEDGCIYEDKVTETVEEYRLANAAKSLFQTLLADVEKEVQAKYNAKLTKEQNVCLANNSGGIKGSADNGSTFMWVKLRSAKVPKSYQSKGLSAKQFVTSNDLYGSFCRARITLQSDDKDIQNLLKSDNFVTYFAVGDSFTCGSWISNKDLEKISDVVGQREMCKEGYGRWDSDKQKCMTFSETGKFSDLSAKEKVAYAWGTVGPALAGLGIGLGLTESGLLTNSVTKSTEKKSGIQQLRDKCVNEAKVAVAEATAAISTPADQPDLKSKRVADALSHLNSAIAACQSLQSKAESGNALDCSSNSKDANGILNDANSIARACLSAEAKNVDKNVKAANTTVPIVTTLGAGLLGNAITSSVIKINRENIKNKAAQQWMAEVGEHIQCYLGADELGTYGDVISIELD